MPDRYYYSCPECHRVFNHPAEVEYRLDSKLIKCPYCKLKFETLPQGCENDGVDPKGVV